MKPTRAQWLSVLLPGSVLAAWIALSAYGLIPVSVLPSPEAVIESLIRLYRSGDLWLHVGASLFRVYASLLLGTALGILFGLTIALSPRARDYLYPAFQVLVYVPILAWLPLLMVLLGIGETLKIVLLVKVVFIPVALHTYNAVRDISSSLIEVGHVYRLGPAAMLRKIYFPAAFIPIWGGIRYAHARAWAALVIVEILASSEGLGYLLVEGQVLLQLDLQLAAIAVLAVLGFTGDRLFSLAYLWSNRWMGPRYSMVRP